MVPSLFCVVVQLGGAEATGGVSFLVSSGQLCGWIMHPDRMNAMMVTVIAAAKVVIVRVIIAAVAT